MGLAPIVLFVYNRPWHTEQTLNALAQNELAKESILYIYADGPKTNANQEDLEKIKKTREIIKSKKWCNEVHIIESETNKGLANSVIEGITTIINKCGKIIVLEDDIVTAKGFIKFMNDALNTYEQNKTVAGVSGWSFPIKVNKDETYFSRVGACWGWATWKREWENLNFNTPQLIKELKETNRISEFNIDQSYDFFSMLTKQLNGQIDSWAIRFYANYFLMNKLFLFPKQNLVCNIGFDGTGTHSALEKINSNVFFEKQFVDLKHINPIEKKSIRKKISSSFMPGKSNFVIKIISQLKKKYFD